MSASQAELGGGEEVDVKSHSSDNETLQSDNEQKMSFGEQRIIEHDDDNHDRLHRHLREFPSSESLQHQPIYNFPVFPMLESSDEDEKVSIVSSLSLEDSQWQRTDRPRGSPTEQFLNEIVRETPAPPPRIQPPREIFIPITDPDLVMSPSTVPDWWMDSYKPPQSPLSASCAPSSANCSYRRADHSITCQALFPPTDDRMESISFNIDHTFGPSQQQQPTPRSKPELATRASTFPNHAIRLASSSRHLASTPKRSAHQRFQLDLPLLHSPSLASDGGARFNAGHSSRSAMESSGPRRPTHRVVKTAGSIPLDGILVNGNLVSHVQLPKTNTMPLDVLSLSSSAEDAKLLGERRRRLVRKGVSGTVSVGSIVGQSTFVTAPTSSSSTGGGMDPVESFQRHLKVQRMLNTIVAAGTSSSRSVTHSHSSRVQRELKCVWNQVVSSPIQRLLSKVSPKSATAAAGSATSPSPQVELKRATGCLT